MADFNIDKEFWNNSNILSKICLVIGGFFLDLSFKLSGYFPNEN